MQQPDIKGYRELNEAEGEMINRIKEMAVAVGELVEDISGPPAPDSGYEVDLRWANIAKTDLQKGFMSLIRSVARPETF